MNLSRQHRPTTLYEELTATSRDLNYAFGDRTGRTVTVGVGDGIFNATNGALDLDGEEVHVLMGLSLVLLLSGNRTLQVMGGVGALALVLAWHAGKQEPARISTHSHGSFKERQIRVLR